MGHDWYAGPNSKRDTLGSLFVELLEHLATDERMSDSGNSWVMKLRERAIRLGIPTT